MTLKDSIENNPVLWTLGMLLTGFLAGIGTYHWGLDFVGRRLVPQAAVVLQNNQAAVLTTELKFPTSTTPRGAGWRPLAGFSWVWAI